VPTVARIGSYRFFFFSNEGVEPAHVHIQREQALAKFWLRPVVLASSSGLASHELRRLQGLVEEHREHFQESWREFFRS
jgi:hypothetical protein